ncbi:hypothetical protein LC040_12105 [Bacillus tianshenii]|nr:hypothetical protein LC040_12105 [Bacillus tianshenii]
MVPHDNLYYPVEYMLKKMMKKEVDGLGNGQTCCTCLDAKVPVRLVRSNGRLTQVIGEENGQTVYTVDLIYSGVFLYQVIASCPNGYSETYTLQYTNGILESVDVQTLGTPGSGSGGTIPPTITIP